MRRKKKKRFSQNTAEAISDKANYVLNLTLLAFLFIAVRVWQLTTLEHEAKWEEAQKPKRKMVYEPAKRGTIRDRFNLPLAINTIDYQVAIIYSAIQEVPAARFEVDETGNKRKIPLRKLYVEELSSLLGRIIGSDPQRIEDLIYSKASFFGQTPFVLKSGLSEEQFFRLSQLSTQWPGIFAQRVAKRVYPQNKVAGDVIGYMGPIDKTYYDSTLDKIHSLQSFLASYDLGEDPPLPEGLASIEEVELELGKWQERAYTLYDQVGKSGIEKKFETTLRGYHGKKEFESDAKGAFLREVEGTKSPEAGQRLLLTLSLELQEYAEQLLAFHEKVREARPLNAKIDQEFVEGYATPWIKGGAIVAIDPKNGEVLALASFPRFNPNDFIPKANPEEEKNRSLQVHRWLETPRHLKDLWDQNTTFNREFFHLKTGRWEEEKVYLTWNHYLELLFLKKGPAFEALKKIQTLSQVVKVERAWEEFASQFPQTSPLKLLELLNNLPDLEATSLPEPFASWDLPLRTSIKRDRQILNDAIPEELASYDKLLMIDLLRVAVDGSLFFPKLLENSGKISIEDYRNTACALTHLRQELKEALAPVFHALYFVPWRTAHQKEFLKQLRQEEKAEKRYAKPYLDYLDMEEKKQYLQFFAEHEWAIIEHLLTGEPLTPELESLSNHFPSLNSTLSSLKSLLAPISPFYYLPYLQTMRSFNELNRPLYGSYRLLPKPDPVALEKHLATAFYPSYGYGFGRSYAYRQSTPQGSIFKLVVAASALNYRYKMLEEKGIRPTLSNLNPLEIIDEVRKVGNHWQVGFHINGEPIPQIYKGGRVPRSMSYHLGRMDIVRAIETSSNPYFSLLAGDILPDPDLLTETAANLSYGSKTGIELPGEIKGALPSDLKKNRTGLYITAIGQHSLVVTPLQTALMLSAIANGGKVFKPHIALMTIDKKESELPIYAFPQEVKKERVFPPLVRELLLQGMEKLISSTRPEDLLRFYPDDKEVIRKGLDIKNDLYGKSSSAEALEYLPLGAGKKPFLATHSWFGALTFQKPTSFLVNDPRGTPELVVVVYCRYGKVGKEGLPIAALMAKKWREIQAKHEEIH